MRLTPLILVFAFLLAIAGPCAAQDRTPSTSNRPKAWHGTGSISIQQGPSVWKNSKPCSVPKAVQAKDSTDQTPNPSDMVEQGKKTIEEIKKDAEKKKLP